MLAQPSGVLRASLPVGFATVFLAPLVAEFAGRYPAITFEFDLSPRRADLVAEPVDVAIRMGESQDSNLISRQITQLPRHLYAAPRYIERTGELSHPRDLAAHECLRLRSGQTDTWTLLNSGESVAAPVQGRFLLNDVGMIQRLAGLECGIAVLAEAVAAEDVAFGRLCRVLPEWEAPPISVYAITETKLLPAKTQLFIDFLRARLRNSRDTPPVMGPNPRLQFGTTG